MAHDDLRMFRHWEQTLADLLERTSKFPKSTRFTFSQRIDTFSQRIDNLALDIIEALVGARYSRSHHRIAQLRDIDGKLTRLRVLLRVNHSRGLLSHRGYEHTARRVDEAGRMVGVWLRGTGDDKHPIDTSHG